MATQWSLREYKDGDERSITQLYRLVFGVEVSDDWWAWRYKRNPGGEPVIVLAESDHGIVGQYALVPRLMRVDGSLCLGSLSLDTMVHPEYRGQGMFVTLAKQAYELAARRGIHFVYGFPNQNSHQGFVTGLNWLDLCNGIPLWVKPLNFENVLLRYLNNRLITRLVSRPTEEVVNLLCRSRKHVSSCSVTETSTFNQRFDILWDDALRNHNIILVRDQAYLTWRYVEKPNNGYVILTADRGGNLLGYIVLTCMDNFGLRIGHIVDMVTASRETTVSRDLISAAIKHFEWRQMDMVGCLMLPNVHYSNSLKHAGFLKAPNSFLPQRMYLGVRALTSQYPTWFLAHAQNWFITFGDHDAV